VAEADGCPFLVDPVVEAFPVLLNVEAEADRVGPLAVVQDVFLRQIVEVDELLFFGG